MDERSAIILNFGLHFVESVNFSNYRQLIDGLVNVLQGKHKAMRSNVTQRKYRGTVIWKTTTAINKEKASNIHLGHKRFITQQVGAYCDIRGYSHDIDRNDFHSGTSSCHLHIVFLCICLHDTETTVFFPYKSFQNEFIPVFIPNRILVLVRNFILVSCKLKRNFVPNTPNTRNGWVSPEHFEVGFSEGAKVAFPIVTKSYKLIGDRYKTKFVCSLFVGVQYCQITKPCLCGKWQIWVTKVKQKLFYHPKKYMG